MSSYKQKIAQLIVQLREAQECVAELLEVTDVLHRAAIGERVRSGRIQARLDWALEHKAHVLYETSGVKTIRFVEPRGGTLVERSECCSDIAAGLDKLVEQHAHRYDQAYNPREDAVNVVSFKCAHCGSVRYKHSGEKFSDIECVACGAEYTLMQWRGGMTC